MKEKSELTENGTEVVVVVEEGVDGAGVKEVEAGPDSVLEAMVLLLPSGKEMLKVLDTLTEILGPEDSLKVLDVLTEILGPGGSLVIEPDDSMLIEPDDSMLIEPEDSLLGVGSSTAQDDDGGVVGSHENAVLDADSNTLLKSLVTPPITLERILKIPSTDEVE
ncbi:hypothetical protein MPER_04446 [Moniliophthora perniciosa FA553]|nr:hypothetical protein MPER_04446 [Moniliophthora perniciosa FA553]